MSIGYGVIAFKDCRYITLEFVIISTIIMTIIIFWLFGWRPSWISSILGHFPRSDFLGLFFSHFRSINELISIGKPFPPILLNLCTLFTGLLGNTACHLLIPFLRIDKYHNVRVHVPFLPEIGKKLILADLYEVSIFLNSVAIRTYLSASVTGT